MPLKPYISSFSAFHFTGKVLISPHVSLLKSSKKSSKTAIYYLRNQPLQFGNCAVRDRVCVIVQCHCDVGMSHNVFIKL